MMTRLDDNQLKRSTDSSKHEEAHNLTDNPDPEISSSYSSEKSSLDSGAKKKKCKKKKKLRKHQQDDSSDPSFSNDSYYSDDSDYRLKRRRNKIHWENDPIKHCATITSKLLTTAYKSKICRFKMDEDPLQRRIYFFTLI